MIDASHNLACADCGANSEYMTRPYANPPVGTNYCAFIFEFEGYGYACRPQQHGESVPVKLSPGMKLPEAMTRSFSVVQTCTEGDVKCDGNKLMLCDSNAWQEYEVCTGSTPICDANAEECKAADSGSYDNVVSFDDLEPSRNYTVNKTYSFADGSSLTVNNVAVYTADHVISGSSIIAKGDKGSKIEITGLQSGLGKLAFDFKTWAATEAAIPVIIDLGKRQTWFNITKNDTTVNTFEYEPMDDQVEKVTITFDESNGRAVIDNIRFTSVH